jgi:hypothetical protein
MDRNSRRINMRSADPAAYDQFIELTTAGSFPAGGTAGEYNLPFRALYLTGTAASTAAGTDVSIKQMGASGVFGSAKQVLINTGVGAPSFILPISGEFVKVNSLTGKLYALI